MVFRGSHVFFTAFTVFNDPEVFDFIEISPASGLFIPTRNGCTVLAERDLSNWQL